MGNFIYNEAKKQSMTGGLDFSSIDARVMLVMTNSTAGTNRDANTIAGISTLDEYDGTGYTPATGGVGLTGETVTEDPGNNRAYFSAGNATFTALGQGTRQALGAILIKWITNQGLSLPVGWIDTPGFPFTGNGSNVTIQWNAAGIVQQT